MTPDLEFLLEVKVSLAPALEIGATPLGARRIIAIESGTFEGPLLRGNLLPGGADWQLIRPDGVAAIEARYLLRTDDGVLIPVINRGLRHGPEEVMARLAAGHDVDPGAYYFRTAPIFEAPAGRYDWLNRSIFIATGARFKAAVHIRVYRVL